MKKLVELFTLDDIVRRPFNHWGFCYLAGTEDKYVLALKSEEDGSKIASYIMVFDLQGKLVMKETLIGNYKFEGVEFV